MVHERSDRRVKGSGPARQESVDNSTRLAEPEQESRSRSYPVNPSDSRPYISERNSVGYSGDDRDKSGSSVVNPQSPGSLAARTTLEYLFEELRPKTLAGPVSLIGLPTNIGEGGQFVVYKQEVGFLDRQTSDGSVVAVKRPKTNSNSGGPMDLADPKMKGDLSYIRNEIQALTHPVLRHHPNIVRLLSWAFGNEWDRPFFLVLELAHEDLASALKQNVAPPDPMKVQFCSDIANGLVAIHEARFVHGDLKPANVLLFRAGAGFVAKLADFGYSANETDQAVGRTPGWQPPELKPSRLGDCFSFGLLVWSVLFLMGEAPPHPPGQSRKELALAHVMAHRNQYAEPVTKRIETALSGLLEEDMAQRSCQVDGFFIHETSPDHVGLRDSVKRYDPHILYNFISNSYRWEIQPRAATLLNGLYRTTQENPKALESLTPGDALAIGLCLAVQIPAEDTSRNHLVRKFLEISARQRDSIGCEDDPVAYQVERTTEREVYHSIIAGDLLSRFCKTLGEPISREDATEWLEVAVDTGSVHARADLYELDPERLSRMLESFCTRGGYNVLYRNMAYSPNELTQPAVTEVTDQNILHRLAAFGSCEELKECLEEHRDLPLNAFSEEEETALYIACARGSWKHAELLLDKGADPSIKCTASRITSLHWVFAFDGKMCETAVRRMLQAGADINASIPPNFELPFPHYPFVLPAGTPLHWAVATSSHDATKALLEAGADALLRNGSDPYMYDDRIRHLYAIGGPDAEGCTFAEPGCLGLSAVDLAAVHRDPFLLQIMAERGDRIDINSADEEGLTVFHRLATSQVFRTSCRVRYPARMFRGLNEAEALPSLIAAIKSLGGDIERLTSTAETAVQKKLKPTDLSKSSYTPLMLAMLEGDHSLVHALLNCGASANTENASRATALFHVSHKANAEQPQLLQCFQTLFTHSANINHHSSTGNTPLLAAAQGRVLGVFDFLLSQGAHIDERDRTERSVFPGKSVFAFFASYDNNSDDVLLQLLTKYVFHSSKPERKRRVVQDGSDSGSTLLHECAGFAMPNCTKALLQNGAHVNALECKTRFGKPDGRSILYETPLDRLKSSRDFTLKMMLQRRTLSTDQANILRARWNEVEEHIKSERGKNWTSDMTRE